MPVPLLIRRAVRSPERIKSTVIGTVFEKHWKDMGFQIRNYSDEDCEASVRSLLADKADISSYRNSISRNTKNAIWILCELYAHGGIYADLQVRPHMDISSVFDDGYEHIFVTENEKLYGGFFVAPKGSPIILKMLILALSNTTSGGIEEVLGTVLGDIFEVPFGESGVFPTSHGILVMMNRCYYMDSLDGNMYHVIKFQNDTVMFVSYDNEDVDKYRVGNLELEDKTEKPFGDILFVTYYNTHKHRLIDNLRKCAQRVASIQVIDRLYCNFSIRNEVLSADLCVIWNGFQMGSLFVTELCKQFGVPYIIIEQGLFPQEDTYIVDASGICERSSSFDDKKSPSPELLERVRSHYATRGLLRTHVPRCTKKYLIVLQLSDDTTVYHTTRFRTMAEFVAYAYERFNAPDVEFVVCKHPKDPDVAFRPEKNMRMATKSTIQESLDADLTIGISSTVLYEIAGTGCPVHVYAKKHPLNRGVDNIEHLLCDIVNHQIPHKFTSEEFEKIVKRIVSERSANPRESPISDTHTTPLDEQSFARAPRTFPIAPNPI